ncbi:MAG: TldD/PmbA family protein, partial [Bdellovibrionales bacterium]|nr:TldD/PmbA family protein [Bdellovibrionales bacterium]
MHSKLKGYLDQLNSKAEWTSLRFVEDETRTLFARDEKLRPTFHSKTSGIMVEVLVDGQFSYAGTCDVSLEGVQAAYQKAMSMAEIAKNWQLIPFSQDQRPQAIGSYSSPSKISFDTMGIAELSSLLIDCTKTMKKSDSILSRHAYATHSITRTHFVSSNGSDFQQTISQNLLNLEVTAENNGQVQSRSSGSEVSQMGYEFFDRNLMMEQANNISEQVLELLQAENCPSDTREVILAPSQLYLQIHESIGHPLELDRILGDERNYAGWSFVNLEDFGKLQYGSSKLNVTFDPTIETELASYMFDDTGAKAEKQYLIKDGVLLRGLGSLESQLRSKVPGVACARATSWNRPPLDRMANLNIEPGESSLEDMIASVERG